MTGENYTANHEGAFKFEGLYSINLYLI